MQKTSVKKFPSKGVNIIKIQDERKSTKWGCYDSQGAVYFPDIYSMWLFEYYNAILIKNVTKFVIEVDA